MPGYFFDVSGSRPEGGLFEAPSDALVVLYDSAEGIVKGVLTIGSIVERTGPRATTPVVYDAILALLDQGVAQLPGDWSDEGDEVGSVTEQQRGAAEVLPFQLGVVVMEGENVGIRPTWREWGAIRELPASGSKLIIEAFQAMGQLPGFPVTHPGSRWYVCPNGHRHSLPAGSEGSPCPTCHEPLRQDT